ncbi:beta strand repeat-containing protein [Leadbettera azotonutricia]|uniref:Putative extracellular nuclease n=1 Tax=Leadbettera azotonutricia (strain ATCC BAA-888 / DSM 13862 / ZAS-9) TaxID=545695 RepID=F5YEY4_LEAAZ|nr:right-handed parallel beta-helix repeat-containing protein [Leadbettera azotonutricia]AEF80151.1 putative extracellular nuclease [Leadbettera azotonutricia ZAS-9]
MKRKTTILALIIAALFMASCDNIASPETSLNGNSQTGLFVLKIDSLSTGRTILPAANINDFEKFDLTFTAGGQSPVIVSKTRAEIGEAIELAQGTWALEITAYITGPGEELVPAARGSESDIQIVAGTTVSKPVALNAIVSEGEGTFAYTVNYPGWVAIAQMTITPLSDGGTAEQTLDFIVSDPAIGALALNAGYYRVVTALTFEDNNAGKHEILHIYKNLTSSVTYTFTPANFEAITVTSTADSGTGTFRAALNNVSDGGAVKVMLPVGSVITLTNALPEINKSISIEGNGVILDGSGIGNTSQLLNISNTYAAVVIKRVHFRNRTTSGGYGAAIRNDGILTLQSCIFSGNKTTGSYGGAVYTSGTLTVQGCTFYNNTSGSYGGAIYRYGGTLTFTGNIFYGNTATYGGPIVYGGGGTVTSGGFNMTDKPDGAGTDQSGWTFTGSDTQVSAIPFGPVSFKLRTGVPAAITTRPEGYPETDFYGEPIPASNAAAGAVQAVSTGYYLDLGVSGSGMISVNAGSANADGLYDSGISVTLEVTDGNEVFWYWTLNGTQLPAQVTPKQYTLTMGGDTAVGAVFCNEVTSVNNTGTGTLRAALTNVSDRGVIRVTLPAGSVINLTSVLPEVNKSITIEGNGVILDGSGIAETGDYSQLLNIGSAGVVIKRVHFRNRTNSDYGAAIRNSGNLTLQSCIFSGNKTTASNAAGGVIYHNGGALTVQGCTFYKNLSNASNYSGSAIYNDFGTLILTGNIFYDNTASLYRPIVINQWGTVISGGFNVTDHPGGTDQSGWTFASSDTQVSVIPFGRVSFKSGKSASGVITARPEDYPDTDFYGDPIPASNAAAGAVQAAVTGYALDYGANGSGTVNIISGSANEDGFYNPGTSVTLQAANGMEVIHYWTLNGTQMQAPPTLNLYTLTINDDTVVRAVFYNEVTSAADGSGTGTLRAALTNVSDGGTIRVTLPAGSVINLTSVLPSIAKSITIEGNGIILDGSGIAETGNYSQLLNTGSSAGVVIKRVHFRNRTNSVYGAAIRNSGNLTLQSCIFSGNKTTASNAYGGAVYHHNGGALTVQGCTFYNNTSGYSGGAIYSSSGTLTFTGNIFYGNTASYGPIVGGGTVTSGGFNMTDKPDGTESSQSGWNFTSGDTQVSSIPFGPVSFKLKTGIPAVITTRPEDYPETDFYGDPIPASNAAAGAVQAVSTGYYLDYGVSGSGTVSVTAGSVNTDGFYDFGASVTLEATEGSKTFLYWTLNGTQLPTQPTPKQYTLTISGDTVVRAVFGSEVTNAADTGTGTLRTALTNASDGDTIKVMLPTGNVINLATVLPQITKSITIEGNGVILDGSGIAGTGNTSQLFYISGSSTTVVIKRFHFRNRTTSYYGTAIGNTGNLTLQSCIFSGNKAGSNGGVIYHSDGVLTVQGCTFYNNTSGYGGAIYKYGGTLTLTGNIFYGNTASYYGPIVYNSSGTSPTSGGFNVTDKPNGTGTSQSGWTFTDGDVQVSELPFELSSFKPKAGALGVITTRPDDYPETDFNGAPIPAANAASGAVQAAASD